jgi:hypothetical protein
LVAQRIQSLLEGIPEGGPREAAIRALLYVRMPEGTVDERGFRFLQRVRDEAGKGLTLTAFKKLVREQYFMLLLDEERAVESIPGMLARDPKLAAELGRRVGRVIEMVGLRSQSARDRMEEMKTLFKIDEEHAASKDRADVELEPTPQRPTQTAKGSKRV